jgi:peptidoglycan/xylan/chitin deacetylase (PgdA/CDA1 family)
LQIHLKRTAKRLAIAAAGAPPVSWNGALTKATLGTMRIGFSPPVPGIRYPWREPAAACISVDFDVTKPGREGPNRAGTIALVGLSEKYGIPLTWAVCGRTAEEDWASYSRIVDSAARQEVGVHTYSHIDASQSTADELEAEIKRCIAVLALSSPPRTFVFPWNKEAHFDLLKGMGFTAYRGRTRVIGGLSKARGLWNIPPVYYVDQKSIGAATLMKRFADLCIEHGTVYHLWTHPWSIVEEGGSAERMVRTTLEPVFEHLSKKRDEALLHIATMGGIAAGLEESARVAPAISAPN